MSYPGDGVDFPGKNHIDDVRMYLDNRHPCSYAVYNLSGRTYKAAKFENRVGRFAFKKYKIAVYISDIAFETHYASLDVMILLFRNN